MLLVLILLAALAAVVADILRFLGLRRRGTSPRVVILFAVWAAATDLLPLAVAVAGWFVRDNTAVFMFATMWMFWVWIATVPPRLLYYLFEWMHLRWAGLAVALCFTVACVWGATAGRTTIRTDRLEICSERLPRAFDGMRFVQLSDIHLGTVIAPERELRRLVDSVNALRPDAVLFTGDLVNIRCTELDTRAAALLGRIEAPVYAVTGNHDIGDYIKDTTALPPAQSLRCLLDRERAMGWHVLEDTTVYLRRGGDSIALAGIAYNAAVGKRRHDRMLPPADLQRIYRGVPDSLFTLTLVHLPQLWPQILDEGRSDVTLAGHVHSMQMKIAGWSPAAWLYDRWSGRYDADGRTLYISDGTGCVAYPMRLGAWPQITLITLSRCE